METNGDLYLLHKTPTVTRVRGFRLYLANGKRLVDLWLNGGAAILGHTPPNMLRELKNTASRGLYAPFPHFTEGRLIKALLKLFPGHCFRLYAAPPPELRAAVLWRPFTNPESPFAADENTPFFVPVLPGIQLWRDDLPLGLCVAAAKTEDKLAKFPPNDILPPILLATAARGIHNLAASPQRAKPVLPKVFKAIQNSIWQRKGIYLNLKEKPAPETWAALFQQFLDAGFLLPPVSSQPLILPGELSPGEEAKLAALFR